MSFKNKAGQDEKGAWLKLKIEEMSHEVSHHEPRKVQAETTMLST